MPSTSRSSTGFLHETFDFLRLPGEPCVHFGEREIHDVLVKRGTAFMDLLEDFYRRWKDDATLVRQPRKTIFSSAGVRGDWRVMPCVVRRRAGPDVKAVKVVGTNEEERVVRDKISVGRALLLHPTDHFVQATFDVGALSSFRTAALGVLAWRHAGRGVVPVGLAGAGRIGFYTALLLADWIPFVFLKYKPRETRFRLSTGAELTTAEAAFSAAERAALLRFCHLLGFDYGELDVLRDAGDGRLYVVDANTTPTLHYVGYTRRQKRWIVRALAAAFDRAFLQAEPGGKPAPGRTSAGRSEDERRARSVRVPAGVDASHDRE